MLGSLVNIATSLSENVVTSHASLEFVVSKNQIQFRAIHVRPDLVVMERIAKVLVSR